jgi:hypothetical protein
VKPDIGVKTGSSAAEAVELAAVTARRGRRKRAQRRAISRRAVVTATT